MFCKLVCFKDTAMRTIPRGSGYHTDARNFAGDDMISSGESGGTRDPLEGAELEAVAVAGRLLPPGPRLKLGRDGCMDSVAPSQAAQGGGHRS